MHGESSGASQKVGVDIASRNGASPEQSTLGDPWVEIVQLRPRTGVVDVNSDEAKSASAHMAIAAPELALHKSHIVGDERKGLDEARFAICPIDQAVGEGDARSPLEIINGRGIFSGIRKGGSLHVEDSTVSEKVETVGNGNDESDPRGCGVCASEAEETRACRRSDGRRTRRTLEESASGDVRLRLPRRTARGQWRI